MALVLLPKPVLPSYWRLPALAAIFLALHRRLPLDSAVGYGPDQAYADLVSRIANSVVRSPAEISGYLAGFTLGLRFLIFGTIISFAARRAGQRLSARALVALQAFLYLCVMAFVDATLVVVEALVGAPVAPTTLLGNFAAIGLAVLAMTRMQYANFALPKPSAVPFAKRPRLSRTRATLIGVTVAAMAICMAGLLSSSSSPIRRYQPALALVLPVPVRRGHPSSSGPCCCTWSTGSPSAPSRR